jgi:hypothetical protein
MSRYTKLIRLIEELQQIRAEKSIPQQKLSFKALFAMRQADARDNEGEEWKKGTDHE